MVLSLPEATVQQLGQIFSYITSDGTLVRYKSSPEVCELECSRDFFSFYWWGCCGKAGCPEDTQENRSLIYRNMESFALSLQQLYDTLQDQVTSMKRCIFPYTKYLPARSVNILLIAWFPPVLACTSLCHRNTVTLLPNNLSPSHNFHPMGHFSLLCQCLATWMESCDKIGSYSWGLTNVD